MTTSADATARYGANPSPGGLRIVQDLANTIGVASEPDLLASADGARTWLESATGRSGPELRESDLARMRGLRAAIRAVLRHGAGDQPAGAEVTVRLLVGDEGILLQPADDLIEELESRTGFALVNARASGEVARLKLCANPRCEVAFFDESRNGAGRWHSSARCGNAARVRAHRARADRLSNP